MRSSVSVGIADINIVTPRGGYRLRDIVDVKLKPKLENVRWQTCLGSLRIPAGWLNSVVVDDEFKFLHVSPFPFHPDEVSDGSSH